MDSPCTVEIEPEVRLWLMNLRDDDYLAVELIADLARPSDHPGRAVLRTKALCEAAHEATLDVYTRTTEAETKEW